MGALATPGAAARAAADDILMAASSLVRAIECARLLCRQADEFAAGTASAASSPEEVAFAEQAQRDADQAQRALARALAFAVETITPE